MYTGDALKAIIVMITCCHDCRCVSTIIFVSMSIFTQLLSNAFAERH